MSLTEAQFEQRADQTLNQLVEALEGLENDTLEADLESGVLTITFEDDSQFVINSHRAARQIWMSANATAWHFDPVEHQWLCSKSKDELWSVVNENLTNKLGPVSLKPERATSRG